MTISIDTPVGRVATEYPFATRVFHRYDIDFCCGGGKSLGDACAASGVDAATVIREIERESAGVTDKGRRWDEATIDELIDHILVVYHRPLSMELRRLHVLGRRVLTTHGDRAPELEELFALFAEFEVELEKHMAGEEVAFPLFREGRGAEVLSDVDGMEREHDDAGTVLRRIRELTNDFTVPEGACESWRALWEGLAELEVQMHEHIHLENNVLFPRALGHPTPEG